MAPPCCAPAAHLPHTKHMPLSRGGGSKRRPERDKCAKEEEARGMLLRGQICHLCKLSRACHAETTVSPCLTGGPVLSLVLYHTHLELTNVL
uniref:Uncharacterized protein n=1 Tax=Podarcis muralis TaxID=64176 RepID=A0A670HRZ4_PODMU